MIRINHRPLRWAALSVLAAASTLFAGCANFYVDNGLRAADTAQITQPASPKPVQLFFSFQTKGTANAQATQQLKGQVTDLVKQSGLFSEIRETAAPDAGVLQLTINNVPLSDDAVSKGIMTGLTLGLAGSTVGDGYVCDLQYTRSDNSPKIQAKANHAIYTSIGASNGPEAAATKMSGINEAVTTMVRQGIKTLLVKLSNNPQFQATP
ncbi:hypothetical protein [Aquabacterium sp. CECT 9606]|uniref:hypothetical protein n=1 Tax=Aquabacterium sp. CECT 9606 TaxID=2845822 RepID=UPI001E32D967|nr:hypothetical protein [Aquabacterium sp. CECT 9606]CAH0348207.1 hypothetical protein AQB9606_00429 [Aquabacterium sp. CECT 9606]